MNKNDLLKVRITDLDQEGIGIGHTDTGMALFVKDTVPGDLIMARVVKVKKSLAFGRVEQVIEPSSERIKPACAKARACGGCVLQQMAYPAQLAVKQRKVEEALRRIGGVEHPELLMEPITGMEVPWEFRNKMQFPFGQLGGHTVLGFYAGRTHALVPLDDCAVGHPVNREIMRIICRWADTYGISVYDETTGQGLLRHLLTRVGFSTGELMICLVINGRKVPYADKLWNVLEHSVRSYGVRLVSLMYNVNTERTNRILGAHSFILQGEPYITDTIGPLSFRISPGSFYQVNPVQTQRIYEKAMEYADLSGNETVWDMYCGTGTISLFLSQKAHKVYGVEIVPEAIRDARQNAADNGIKNVEFFVGKAEEVVPDWFRTQGAKTRIDVVVVDPPRKGCAPMLLDTLVRMQPERIVYVSCNPATLARDVKILETQGYVPRNVAPFDAFCHTMHCESVVKLVRAGS